jgi:hypothetical protein
MQRAKLLYPFLFAIIPILSAVTHSVGYASLSDIGAVLGFVLVACGLVYVVVAVTFGWSNPLIPLIIFVMLLWFYECVALILWAREVGGGYELALVLIPAVATVLVVWWLGRRPRILDRVNTFLTLTAVILVAWLGARLGADQVRARSAVRNSVLVRELARPIPVRRTMVSASDAPLRDIYLIVLDEYANSSVLWERFGFKNRVFEDSLRQLGFTIPRMVRSNYAHSVLSLPSLLNFSHLDRLSLELGPRAKDPAVPNYLLENNRTVAFLKARGYEFLFFPSQWWISTGHNRNADWEFRAWRGFDLAREATRSDLRRSLIGTTLLRIFASHAYDAKHVRRTLYALEQVPLRAEPTFAFAHILNPHSPYVFDENCRTVREDRSGRKGPGIKARYIAQLQCLNHLVLGVVTTILERSSVPPIILLQGDHGTSTLKYSWAPTAAAVSPAQARERFGSFGAYSLPDGGDRLFTDSITVVNVLQKVLGYYFNAEIRPAPDQLYMSLEQAPYDFVQVDPTSLAFPPSPKIDSKYGTDGARRRQR